MSNKKKLLIYAHYYIPDTASTGQILRELAEGMLDKFDITVMDNSVEVEFKCSDPYQEVLAIMSEVQNE